MNLGVYHFDPPQERVLFKASTSIHCVLKHILLRIKTNKRIDRFSHFKFPHSRRLGTLDSTMHLAVAQPGSEALMNSPNLKGMQPWDVLLAKYGNNLVPSSMFAISNSLVQLEHVSARLQALISVAANELISVWHTLCQENRANLWIHCGFQLAGSATFVQQFSRSFTNTIYTFIGFFSGFLQASFRVLGLL